MALIKCPECSKEVSDSAPMCPKCGFEVKNHFRAQVTPPIIPKQIPPLIPKESVEVSEQKDEDTYLSDEIRNSMPTDTKSKKNGCVTLIVVTIAIFLLFYIPLSYPGFGVFLSVSTLLVIVALFSNRDRFQKFSWMIFQNRQKITFFSLGFRACLAALIFTISIWTFVSTAQESEELNNVLNIATSLEEKGDLAGAMARLQEIEGTLIWGKNKLLAKARIDSISAKRREIAVEKKRQEEEKRQARQTQGLKILLDNANALIVTEDYSGAIEALSNIDNMRQSELYSLASSLRIDLKNIVDPDYMLSFLVGIPDEVWEEILSQKSIPRDTNFANDALGAVFELNLNSRFPELDDMRSTRIKEIHEESKRLLAKQAEEEKARKEKEALLAQQARERKEREDAIKNADVHGAWAYTQIYVEKQLKSPRSAKFRFGGYRDVTVLSKDKYLVKSYVDSQNSFGALIRTNFVCEIEDVGTGWRVNKFNFVN